MDEVGFRLLDLAMKQMSSRAVAELAGDDTLARRCGKQRTLTQVWAERGSRPTAVKQTGYEWVYCYAAVNPQTGESVSILAPCVNTETMNAFLIEASKVIPEDTHAVMILDGAGWHSSHALEIPANITLLHLPPYSPELNPVERLWAHIKSHYMSNRAFADYDAIFDATTDAINRIDDAAIRSICACGI